MDIAEIDSLLRRHRKTALFDRSSLQEVSFDAEAIQRMVPHRSPYLLIDSVVGIDLPERRLVGERVIPPDEPLFRGHFPGYPVYPGTKLVEMIGQLSLCLHCFLAKDNTTTIDGLEQPAQVRATRILGAYFVRPVLPGDRVVLLAQGLEEDDFCARAAGQALVNGEIACVSAGEVVFLS